MTRRTAFLLNDTSISGHPGCVTVMSVIRENLEKRGISIAGAWPVGLDKTLGFTLHAKAAAASAVIVNGEGTIHNTATRPGARRLLQSARHLRQLTPAPMFLINATIENLRAQDFGDLAMFSRIFVRDSRSRNYLRSHGLEAEVVPDLCLSARFGAAPRTDRVIMTDSVLPAASALLRKCSAAAGATFLPMRRPVVRSVVQWALDPASHKSSANRYFNAISSAKSVVTGRFHAAVFSLLAETPFLAVGSNTPKIQSFLFDALGDEKRMVTADFLRQGAITVPDLTAMELQRIRSYVASAHERAQDMFDVIGDRVFNVPARKAGALHAA